MKSNLHTHSFFSDGCESPESVARLACQAGVGIMALSDHNTFASYQRFNNACTKLGIKAIEAVEIDCIEPQIEFRSELLAYFPNGGAEQIQPILDRAVNARKERVLCALDRAKEYFKINDQQFNYDYFHQWVVQITGYDLWYDSGTAPLYLSNRQLHQFITEQYKQQLPDYVTTQKFQWWKQLWAGAEDATANSLYETIRAVKQAGGYPVLPHFAMSCRFDPEHMQKNSDAYLEQLLTMQQLGLWGMEIHPYQYKPTAEAINNQVREWAIKLGLHLTAGSDFHGKGSKHHIFDGMSFDFEGFDNH